MNYIHPTAIVGKNVKMGTGNHIGPYCVIEDGVSIGNNNVFRAFCVVGSPAEKHGHLRGEGSLGVEIGDENHLSEHVTVHAGVENVTKIGSRCTLLTKAQVGHCARLEDEVTMSCQTVAGGHAILMRGCNLGLGAKVHQRQIIGSYTMLGGNCFVHKNIKILPGMVFVGVPARLLRNNNLALQKRGITSEMLQEEIQRYRKLLAEKGME